MSDRQYDLLNFVFGKRSREIRVDSYMFPPEDAPRPLQPEKLVGMGFRAAMTPCIDCPGGVECPAFIATKRQFEALGLLEVDELAALMTCMARCIKGHALRRIETNPRSAPGLSEDERLMVSLIAASQHGERNAVRACAYTLFDTSQGVDCAAYNASVVARRLYENGIRLGKNAIMPAIGRHEPVGRLC